MPYVGLLGCGNLGSSIIDRWIKDGVDPGLLKVVDNNQEKIAKLGLKPATINDLYDVEILMLAVKPWNVEEALKNFKISPETIVMTMAAGINLKKLAQWLPEKQPACRVMPNIGVKLGLGVLAIAFNKYIDESHKDSIKGILDPLGKTIEMKETEFNAVTALAGSGPAYVSTLLEACVLGGVAGGLSKKISEELILQTFEATVALIKSGMSYEEIRFLVSSPAGTTIAGLEVLESDGIRGSLIKCIKRSSERAKELGLEKIDD